MKLIKSLFLGSAAGLVAVAGASAADLGVKKPSAVEYVKTCPTYGAGFFVVPGTTSCLKLIGRVRADFLFNDPRVRTAAHNTFRARGYVGYDHRTATEYGLLRTYVRAFIGRDNANAHVVNLEYAYIQFAGLTVGRIYSNFEHGMNPNFVGNGSFGGHADNANTNSIAYTYSGGGFSATLGLENAAERNGTIIGAGYAGQAMPDVIGVLGYSQSWGEIKLSGATHQVRSVAPNIDSTIGYAGQLAVKINLPMLGAGSNVWASGAYSRGAVSYTGHTGSTIGQFATPAVDATVSGTALKLTTSWGVAGGIQAYFTPTVWAAIAGTYASHDAFGPNNTVRAASVTGTVAWVPVSGFLIGAELQYAQVSASTGFIPAGTDKSGFTGRIRFQRDF